MSVAIHGQRSWRHDGYAGTSATGTTPRAAGADAPADGSRRQEADAAAPAHPLMRAVMGVLDDFVRSESASATTPAPASSGDGDDAAQGSAARPRAEIRHAIHAFMHELFAAVRSQRGSSDGGDAQALDQGQGRDQGRSQGQGWRRVSIGDLVQRLETLAQSFGSASASADAASAAQPAADATSPAGDASSAGGTVAATSPLLTAFHELLGALHAGSGSEGDGSASDAGALGALLHRLSQALASAQPDARPAPGCLIHVTA